MIIAIFSVKHFEIIDQQEFWSNNSNYITRYLDTDTA